MSDETRLVVRVEAEAIGRWKAEAHRRGLALSSWVRILNAELERVVAADPSRRRMSYDGYFSAEVQLRLEERDAQMRALVRAQAFREAADAIREYGRQCAMAGSGGQQRFAVNVAERLDKMADGKEPYEVFPRPRYSDRESEG